MKNLFLLAALILASPSAKADITLLSCKLPHGKLEEASLGIVEDQGFVLTVKGKSVQVLPSKDEDSNTVYKSISGADYPRLVVVKSNVEGDDTHKLVTGPKPSESKVVICANPNNNG
jgi:hypothetical protein